LKFVWLAAPATVIFAAAIIALPHSMTRAATHESLTSAAVLYARNCVKCHGGDGRAKGIRRKFSGARNLADPEWQDRVSDERIFNVISNGKGRMPGFGKKLSEAEIDSLVQYVRSLKT
jgi:mono/diheme cytochrome c family protein